MPKVSRGYECVLYPNAEQKMFFAKSFGCVRFVWNKMLDAKITYYQEHKKTLKITPAVFKSEFSFLKEVDSLALANTQLNLESAYRKFFKEGSGFPKFKSKKVGKNSYTTNNQGGTIAVIETEDGPFVKFPKVGLVKVKLHRELPADSVIKSATIKQSKSGKYFCKILFEKEVATPISVFASPDRTLGLDYSSGHFYIDSDGTYADYPKYYRQKEKQLRRAQQTLSRRRKGSNNRSKARNKVALIHEKISNQRKNFCHQLSRKITNSYDAVVVEDINMRGLAGSLKLGKSTNDNGFGMFRSFLKYKLEDEGKHFIVINRFYPSSKTCSECGYINKELTLKDRMWVCPSCRAAHDRDFNAAVNIKNEGLRILRSPKYVPQELRDSKLVESV